MKRRTDQIYSYLKHQVVTLRKTVLRLWIQSIPDSQLTELPPEIAKLTNLRRLDLSGNQLTELPPEIAKLTKLQSLDLNGNQLTELPPEITKLTKLRNLDLGDSIFSRYDSNINRNQLTELPPEITKLTNLRRLDLSGNQLTELPPEIAKLTNLRRLDLSGNQLTELPPEIAKLTKLQELDLNGNQLTELPPEIAKLTKLQSLDLNGNQLTELPPEIAKLTKLRNLNLNGNKLTELPPEITTLSILQDLSVRNNKITQLSQEIGLLTKLWALDLSGNQLTELPPEITKLRRFFGITGLQHLYLSGNKLTELPPEITKLTKLWALNLSGNQLTELPPEIAKLTKLQSLGLSGNQLTELPPEIAKLTKLRRLDLGDSIFSRYDSNVSGNQLTELPPEISKLTKLQELGLSGNQLTELPPEISKLTKLQELDLSGNQLTELPPEISKLTKLRNLNLTGNKLTELPPEISKLTSLNQLRIGDNPLDAHLVRILDSQGVAGLLNYAERLSTGGTVAQVRIGQSKILIVGEGAVGKTSLTAQICHGEFVQAPSTHGIEIGRWLTENDGNDYLVRIWDFGGQKEYRITHQFFFTPSTVYVLTWNARDGADRGDVAGWIERIRLRLGDQPARIVLVATHSTGQNPAVDLGHLQELAGPNILIAGQPVPVDNETAYGIAELRDLLVEQIQQLGQADELWPVQYSELNRAIDEIDEPQIPWSRLIGVGQELGLQPNECEVAVIKMAIAGRLTYFKDAVLSGRVILEPDWLTAAISHVLKDRHTSKTAGIVTQEHLAEIWTNPRPLSDGTSPTTFAKTDVAFLIELLHQYGVAFRLPPPMDDSLLVSQMVPSHRPPDLGVPDVGPSDVVRRIKVELGHSASRPSLIPGLTSRAHHYTTGKWWQSGVVFHEPTHPAWAVVELSADRSSLHLTATGPRPEALFSHLRAAIEDRLSEWPGLQPTFWVLCPTESPDGDLCKGSWLHQDLVTKYEMGRTTEDCTTCRTLDLPIAQLLGHLPTSTVSAVVETQRRTLSDQFATEDVDALLVALEAFTTSVTAGLDRMAGDVHKLKNDSYSQFRAVLDFLGSEVVDTPRLVSIHPPSNQNTTLNPRSWFNQTWNLFLWCEHPGHEHPVGEPLAFKQRQEWFQEAAPYLKWVTLALRVTPIARYALAIGETLIEDDLPTTDLAKPTHPDGTSFTTDDLKLIRQGIRLTESISKLAPATGDPRPDDHILDDRHSQGLSDTRYEYNDPSLRSLRILLHEIGAMRDGVLVNSELRRTPPSPTSAWNSPASTTTDGRQLWICNRHWIQYTSQRSSR